MSSGFKRSWLATLVCLALLISTLAPALAAPVGPSSRDEAIEFLKQYRIVEGDEYGRINEDKNITRAELAKIAVAAMGQRDLAPMLAGVVRFDDSKGHWGAGYIELGARLGLLKGRDERTFDPNANITYAEVYTILLRMVGREPTPWNPVTIMRTAADLGLAPSVGAEALANQPAVRGVIFESLALAMTTLPLADGKTLAQKYFDSEAPKLVLSGSIPEATLAESVTIAGTAVGADGVLVNGTRAVFQNGNGQFSAVVPLQPGPNTITVEAYDLAGNVATQTITVTQGGEVASIAISGPTQVNAGESITLTVVAKDAQGRTMPNSLLTATVSGGLGTFDVNTGKFTAGSKAGVATITLSSGSVSETHQVAVLGPAAEAAGLRIRPVQAGAFTAGKTGKIEVEIVDAEGNLVAHDGGRNVALSSRDSGLTIVNPVAQTRGGVATFEVKADEVGTYLVTATAVGLSSDSVDVTFASSTRIVLVPTTEGPYKADGATPVRLKVELQNEAGNPVTNTTGEAIVIELDVTSDEATVTRTVTIAAGGRSAEATVTPGVEAETVTVRGIVTSGQPYSVIPVQLRFQEVQVGRPVKFEILGAYATRFPGTPIELRVNVVDSQGNRVEEGSYAFQVEAVTSNNDKLNEDTGLPEGVTITIGDTGFVPAAKAEDGVVARTRNGSATLVLTYSKSGTVTVKVIGVRSTSEAVADNGDIGPASSATSLKGEATATYAGENDSLAVEVEVAGSKISGNSVDAQTIEAIISASTSSSAKVRVYAVAKDSGRLPITGGSVTLQKTTDNGATRVNGITSSLATARFNNGVAEFTIYGTGTLYANQTDEWTITSSEAQGASVVLKLTTVSGKPAKPTIEAAYGDYSRDPMRVTMDDENLVIRVGNVSSKVYVKVYRSGSSTPVFASGLLTPTDREVTVEIPKDKLPDTGRYYVVVNNGYADSERSDTYPWDSSQQIVVEKRVDINISRVTWTTTTQKVGDSTVNKTTLTVTASGVSSAGELRPYLLYLESLTTGEYRILGGADCTLKSGSFTCDISYLNLTSEDLYGSVRLVAEEGWYVRDGQVAPEDTRLDDNYVRPAGHITRAELEVQADGTGRLYLEGVGLNHGRIYPSLIRVGGHALSSSSNATITATSSTQATIPNLSKDLVNKILQSDKTLTAAAGWLNNSGDRNLPVAEAPVQLRVKVGWVEYVPSEHKLVIHGPFANASVTEEKFSLVYLNGDPVLAGGQQVLDFSDANVTVEDDRIEFQWAAEAVAEFEQNMDEYSRNVYVKTEAGWLTVTAGDQRWDVAPVPHRDLRVIW
ncbi:MAG: S-layer homology domain-containing protein [Symbiobacterium sp.]|uniref:S-layer homology domain-containing protein n=1 Tax=Symbiobacterium sp. TaxID=1971213 RepID=UPI003464C512